MNAAAPPVRIGMIGVGGIAAAHAAALRQTGSAELVAVHDLDSERAAAFARAEGARASASVEDLLTDGEVEAVIVCTPNMTHADLGGRVLSAGRHLLMEKPLALTADDARALLTQAHDAGLTLAVGHSHRFSDQGRAIHQAIAAGTVGVPRFVRIVMNGGWIWPGWQNWVLDPALSGGHALHNGVHLVDLASWWLGEPVTDVFAVGQHATSAALQLHDYLVMGLGFVSGATALCEISRAERPRDSSYLELTIVGSTGVLTRTWDADGVHAWTAQGSGAWQTDGVAQRTFVAELESFAAAVRGYTAVVPPVQDAVAAVEVAVAVETSLAEHRTVRLGGTS